MKLKFWKMSGAGNDFVCIDNRRGQIKLNKRQVARLCHRQFGVGADGLLSIETPRATVDADFVMGYYNSDGGRAEMCGNGARCFARFVQKVTGTRKKVLRFATPAGMIQARFFGDQVRVDLTPPAGGEIGIRLKDMPNLPPVHYVDTGVPHLVVPVQDVQSVDVAGMGRKLRFHQRFAPRGVNVNFMEVSKPGMIRIRTYERGVEAETLACGTGMAACAWAASQLHAFPSPIRVRVQSGASLKVYFDKTGDAPENLKLHGPAEFVYYGEIDV